MEHDCNSWNMHIGIKPPPSPQGALANKSRVPACSNLRAVTLKNSGRPTAVIGPTTTGRLGMRRANCGRADNGGMTPREAWFARGRSQPSPWARGPWKRSRSRQSSKHVKEFRIEKPSYIVQLMMRCVMMLNIFY